MKRPFSNKRPIGPFTSDESDPERLIAELENAIGDEGSAREEYDNIIRLLDNEGYEEEAEQVRDIQQDEIKHRKQFKQMLSKVRRDTS